MNKFAVHLTIFKFEEELSDPAMSLTRKGGQKSLLLAKFFKCFCVSNRDNSV